jgi:hypothetical protein
MTINPGGQLSIQDIFGRDPFIQKLWRALEQGSIRIEAERRIGKTHILRKMEAQPPANWEPILLDLESINTAEEFARLICENVIKRLAGWKKQATRLVAFFKPFVGTEVEALGVGFKIPGNDTWPKDSWKTLITTAITDLVEQQQAVGKRVVFLFDEMPWMLQAIANTQSDSTATQILDVLRTLRQTNATSQGFRMVICGSIGLHHVLKLFRKSGYNNQPVNDMTAIEVPPLDPTDAATLAGRLLASGKVACNDQTVPTLISDQTGHFPYYIQVVVNELVISARPASPDNIHQIIGELLTRAQDPCNFRHFIDRLEGYYPGQKNHALHILDHAAVTSDPIEKNALLNIARHAGADDDEPIRTLLTLLESDHYLARDTSGRYFFRHTLLRRWWIIERGL